MFDLGSLIGAIGGIGSAWYSAKQQDNANKQNLREADINRQFQQRMSDTTYQRATEDLEKAGFNKMLALNKGAPMPTGAQGRVESTAKDLAKNIANMQLAKLQSEIDLNRKKGKTEKALESRTYAESGLATRRAIREVIQSEMDRLDYRTQFAGHAGRIASAIYDSSAKGKRLNQIKKIVGLGSDITQMAGNLYSARNAHITAQSYGRSRGYYPLKYNTPKEGYRRR